MLEGVAIAVHLTLVLFSKSDSDEVQIETSDVIKGFLPLQCSILQAVVETGFSCRGGKRCSTPYVGYTCAKMGSGKVMEICENQYMCSLSDDDHPTSML